MSGLVIEFGEEWGARRFLAGGATSTPTPTSTPTCPARTPAPAPAPTSPARTPALPKSLAPTLTENYP